MLDGNDRSTGIDKAKESLKKKIERYKALGHAVQTGIAYVIAIENPEIFDINQDANLKAHKHLRTGIDTTKAEHGALVKLLVDKKIITDEEYFDMVIEFMENEKALYEKILSERFGNKVTLG